VNTAVRPDIFQYLDFRSYLRDYLAYLRSVRPAFSFQWLIDDFGLKSRAHYLDIVRGRTLTPKFVPAYEKICGLQGAEAEYFRAIVGYAQARNPDVKQKYFEHIVELSPNLKTIALESEAYTYFSQWYYPVMISVLDLDRTERDHRVIAKRFKPAISAVQARKALAALQQMGFLSWDDERGEWIFHNKFFSCTREAHAAALKRFHTQMLQLGAQRYRDDYKHQYFSTLTLSVSMKARADIQKMIDDVRGRILDRVKQDSGSEVAMQVNMQMFDVSKRMK